MPDNKKVFHRDVFLATIFTFFLLFILKLVIVNTEYLNPIAQVFEDFQFTDIYYSRYHKPKTEIDTNLVIVNIGENDRAGIIRQLQIIESYHPRAIGLDVTFKDKKEEVTDSVLKAALNSKTPVVTVCNVVYNEEKPDAPFEIERSNPYFELEHKEGFGNFLGEENQTVRYYTPYLNKKNISYPAFATKIVQITDSLAYDRLIKRNKKTEIIYYRVSNYVTLDATDFTGTTDLSFLKNKIVLMGYMGPDLGHKVFEDNHLTPLNKSYGGMALPDKYGIEIHANITSMLLNNTYIDEMPGWGIYIAAFFVCMLHMYVFAYLFISHHKWFHLGAISLQIFSFAVIVSLSLLIFHTVHFKLEPALIVVGVVISVEALYFYEALVKILHNKFNFQSCFAKDH